MAFSLQLLIVSMLSIYLQGVANGQECYTEGGYAPFGSPCVSRCFDFQPNIRRPFVDPKKTLQQPLNVDNKTWCSTVKKYTHRSKQKKLKWGFCNCNFVKTLSPGYYADGGKIKGDPQKCVFGGLLTKNKKSKSRFSETGCQEISEDFPYDSGTIQPPTNIDTNVSFWCPTVKNYNPNSKQTRNKWGYCLYVPPPLYHCPSPEDGSRYVMPDEFGYLRINVSKGDELCTLSYTRPGKSQLTPAGRSFDSNNWEGLPPHFFSFDCSKGNECLVQVPTAHVYQLTGYARSITSDQEISRFLQQATFGPKLADIRSMKDTTFKNWIQEQIDEPITSHREYYRKRFNPRVSQENSVGSPKEPCSKLSRWHHFSFNRQDIGETITVKNVGGMYEVSVGGFSRTQVESWSMPNEVKICDVEEKINGTIIVGSTCSLTLMNPAISFPSPPPNTISLSANVLPVENVPNAVVLNIVPTNCAVDKTLKGAVFLRADEQYFMHDVRLEMTRNTLTNAASGSASKVGCPNAPLTFLNVDSCLISETACSTVRFSEKVFTLDEERIKDFYKYTEKYVYAVSGLTLENVDSPCKTKASRWRKHSGKCGSQAANGDLPPDTNQTLVELIATSTDTNPFIRDIFNPNCEDSKAKALGAKLNVIEVNGEKNCWEHVHPDLYNVYDFSYWTLFNTHPGNRNAFINSRPNPIKQFAVDGKGILEFPSHNHPMSRWKDNKAKFTLVGRLHDEVNFQDIPPNLQSVEMAQSLGAVISQPEGVVRSCGSPGEVANDPTLGFRFLGALTTFDDTKYPLVPPDSLVHRDRSKTATWTMVSLFASDQLRQRIAWALSQILVVTVEQVGLQMSSEMYLTYYDIFVRNALGNYRDVLKEVSFSPMMGEMLSRIRTKSFAYELGRYGRKTYPDENYAREIMQLFSIGLWKLNNDGTRILDEHGEPIQTYTNEDIMTFARAWTGFDYQPTRGNFESNAGQTTTNRIDPLRVVSSWRDVFPKMNLHKGYIGDRYPLCADLPTKHFLKQGAIYRFLGSSSLPELQDDPSSWATKEGIKRVNLMSNSSSLYAALCNKGNTGECRYKAQIELSENINCDVNGIECDVDTVRVVRLYDINNPDTYVFYEYVRRPCVSLSWFNNGKRVSRSDNKGALCADPRTASASASCCLYEEQHYKRQQSYQDSKYYGERVTYQTSENRCSDKSQYMCNFYSASKTCTDCWETKLWTPVSCQVRVKIRSDGFVAIVHDPETGPRYENDIDYMDKKVNPENENWFRVNWKGNYPQVEKKCNGYSCDLETVEETNYCICNTSVVETSVFDDVPSRDEILSQLHIGSVPPEHFVDEEYTVSTLGDITIYNHSSGLATEMIFKVEDEFKRLFYLRNIKSEVFISGSGVSFRNPPSFLDQTEATARDALYETDAVIDHFFYHQNTAPFIAYRLIQRLVTSNPSQRFIENVASAFRSGRYDGIGSGVYGDLAATTAAVLLDRDARSALLDMDPISGALREPILKVLHFMRSMEIQVTSKDPEVELSAMHERIGQMVHYAPSVFSFFKPEYSPPGAVAAALLTAPEAEILTAPNMIGYLHGMISLARFGLSSCEQGFGRSGNCRQIVRGNDDPDESASGLLNYRPENNHSSFVIEELDLLLTNGRLDGESKEIIKNEYNMELSKGERAALRMAQQLFVSTSVFQTQGALTGVRSSAVKPSPPFAVSNKKYKAIVYLYMGGGCDSFNILVPYSNCKSKISYDQYSEVRGNMALRKQDLLKISTTGQVCENFGLHPNLVNLKQAYMSKELLFLANVGTLVEPITKQQWKSRTANKPFSLFSHNTQQKSTQTVKPRSRAATGVIGRIADTLTSLGYNIGSYSISGVSKVLEGEPDASPAPDIMNSKTGITPFLPNPSSDRVIPAIKNLTRSATNIFVETWSAAFHQMIDRTETLKQALKDVELKTPFPAANEQGNGIADQLSQVAKLVQAHETLGTNRDVFYINIGGFDTHNNQAETLQTKFQQIDSALASFRAEMKQQNIWDSVTVISASEFGRTLTSNGQGTDHAWGGNYFMMGGAVKGGKVRGKYPDDLSSTGSLNIGRGRLIPSTSWDSPWNGIAQWFGVKNLDEVLPNRKNFPKASLLTQNDLYN